ncbi:MAG: iron transporter [Hyphomicrobiales bacterium]|nr:MAG: iron transporter [Hyphomicrobiales bacterium]
MPTIPHIEKHFTASESVRDVVIGMADGLTVPFALAAGLSAAVSSTDVVITAGLAEVAAGAIAMGLGGYLAARTDVEHFDSEVAREGHEIDTLREREVHEVEAIFKEYGLSGQALSSVVEAITSDRKRWIEFMMRFELGLERPDPRRAPISAFTIGSSYVVGGLIPLVPYMLTSSLPQALTNSVIVTGIALVIFGMVKGHFTGVNMLKSAFQTLMVGGLAAGAAFALARAFG